VNQKKEEGQLWCSAATARAPPNQTWAKAGRLSPKDLPVVNRKKPAKDQFEALWPAGEDGKGKRRQRQLEVPEVVLDFLSSSEKNKGKRPGFGAAEKVVVHPPARVEPQTMEISINHNHRRRRKGV